VEHPRGWIQKLSGERVIDFERSNLHVVNYSHAGAPAHQSRGARRTPALPARTPRLDPVPHLVLRGDLGFWPLRAPASGAHGREYEVCIDSTLEPGHLTYAETVVAGQSTEEILLTAHICHPSLCNDNLSGIAVATWLVQELLQRAEQPPPATRCGCCSFRAPSLDRLARAESRAREPHSARPVLGLPRRCEAVHV